MLEAWTTADVLDSAPAGIAVCDRELRWIAWNHAMQALTGLDADDVLGERATALAALLCGHRPNDVLAAVLDGIAVDVGEVCTHADDGSLRWLAVRWSPHHGPEGEVAGAVAAAYDVTARHASDDHALRLAAFAREAPSPVLECARDGTVLYANPATHHVLAEVGATLECGFLPRNHRQLVASALEHGSPMRTVEVDVDDRVFSWT